MKLKRERYSDVFVPQLSESDTKELWQRVEARSGRSAAKVGRRWSLALGAAALATSAAVFAVWQAHRAPPVTGQTVEAPARAAQTVELPDGSKVELAAAGRVRIEHFSTAHASIVLMRGGAWFDVQHRTSRSFVVHAGSVDVKVVGTRFRVSLVDGEDDGNRRVDVEVERGVVEVQRAGSPVPVTLQAGERWTSASNAATGNAAVDAAAEATIPPAVENSLPSVASVPSRGSADAASTRVEPQTASDVFDAASRARVAGNSREAAALFDQLRKRYRRDPRAALSALQLGRIRLDELGDVRGAIEALNDALALGGGGSLREDAQARLVEAYERSGNLAACRQAKQAYLTGQPKGAHRGTIERRCAK